MHNWCYRPLTPKSILLANVKAKLNDLILNSQIHRLAAKFYGKDNPREVTQEQVTSVALLWFASVAAFVSLKAIALGGGDRTHTLQKEFPALKQHYWRKQDIRFKMEDR